MNLNTDFFSMLDNFDRLSALISRNNEGLDCTAKAMDRPMDNCHAKSTHSPNEGSATPGDSQLEGR